MRGSGTGALGRHYLHSGITESLWLAVTEAESLITAKLSHAVMLASLYGNPSAKLSEGNDQIHEMYLGALHTIPYIRALQSRKSSETDALVEEWKKMNTDAKKDAKESGSEVGHAER